MSSNSSFEKKKEVVGSLVDNNVHVGLFFPLYEKEAAAERVYRAVAKILRVFVHLSSGTFAAETEKTVGPYGAAYSPQSAFQLKLC